MGARAISRRLAGILDDAKTALDLHRYMVQCSRDKNQSVSDGSIFPMTTEHQFHTNAFRKSKATNPAVEQVN